mgnify:CR=1 FL=1
MSYMSEPLTTRGALLGLLLLGCLAIFTISHVDGVKAENHQLREENVSLRENSEAQKVAMFKQGIWYYRTTELHQTLPQEELK